MDVAQPQRGEVQPVWLQDHAPLPACLLGLRVLSIEYVLLLPRSTQLSDTIKQRECHLPQGQHCQLVVVCEQHSTATALVHPHHRHLQQGSESRPDARPGGRHRVGHTAPPRRQLRVLQGTMSIQHHAHTCTSRSWMESVTRSFFAGSNSTTDTWPTALRGRVRRQRCAAFASWNTSSSASRDEPGRRTGCTPSILPARQLALIVAVGCEDAAARPALELTLQMVLRFTG